jgi:hypothetical protein
MADPAFLIAILGLSLSGGVSAIKLISWFLESDPKAIAQAGRWGAVGLFALSFPLLLGLLVNQRWTEAIGLSAVMLMAFALYGPRVLGQLLPRRPLVPDRSPPARRSMDAEPADGAGGDDQLVLRSIAVLEEYLRRRTGASGQDGSDFRARSSQIPDARRQGAANGSQGGANGSHRQVTSTVMSEPEALEVLGLHPDAEESEINEAHRRLMRIIHPDRGGSSYFAVKVNQAKEILLSRVRPQSGPSGSAGPRKRRRRDRGQQDLSQSKSAMGGKHAE